jgi:hypothetical protein
MSMKRVIGVSAAIAVALACWTGSASAQDKKSRKPAVAPSSRDVKRSLFSGSESQIYAFGYLLPDCTIPIPDIRIVTKPEHGDVRFDEAKAVVTANKSELQKQCHGKSVDTVRMFYKASENYVGKDKVVVDVDSKAGGILRVSFNIEIR